MLPKRCLFFLVIVSGLLWANTIEYMGIAFECDEGCGVPDDDYQAEELVETFKNVIHEVFDDKWGLVDQLGSWKFFDPYEEDNNVIDECLDFTRYDWRRSGETLIDVERNYGKSVTHYDYMETHLLGLNYKDFIKAFSFFREDLSFYASRKKQYLQDLLKKHNQNLSDILAIKQEDFNGILYDSYTDKVLRGTEWAFLFHPVYEEHNNYNGTYSRQIRYAQKHEEKEIYRTESQLKIPEYEQCIEIIDNAYEKSDTLLKEIFLYCLENHQPEGIEFQAVIESFLVGDFLNGVDHLRKLLEIAEENNYDTQITSKIYFLKGQLESECMLYGDAVASLTEAIIKMPSLKEAYLERAAAYFELGEFDLCLESYLQSEIKSENKNSPELISFSLGLSQGLLSGGAQAGIEFIPSLLSSIHGIGKGLWAFAQDPIGISSEFVQASRDCIEFIKSHSTQQIFAELVPELKELVEKWTVLDDRKKGEMTGQIIGKYGIEIFAGGSLVKGAKLYRELKRANNLLNFETIALSERHKAFIKAEALAKANSRKAILQNANLKIHWGQQGKHILGHNNYDSRTKRSILLHANPEKLIQKHAGTGTRIGKAEPGCLNFKEIVNFNEFIGYDVDFKTGEKIATSWGKIHYGKDGVHIVPTKPRG